MYRLYRKMTIYGHFLYIIYKFLGSIFKLFYIQNCVIMIMNSVIKRLMCISLITGTLAVENERKNNLDKAN